MHIFDLLPSFKTQPWQHIGDGCLLLLFQREINKKIIKRRSVKKRKRKIDTKGEGESEREINEGEDPNPNILSLVYYYYFLIYTHFSFLQKKNCMLKA
jgi:hypothetical protein